MKLKEVIVVEGKYDKNALSQVVDATIITTGGFALFKDKELRALLIRLAKERGVIVLTDSDGAGLVIRNHINGLLPQGTVKHAYIPPRRGKEPRKKQAGAEGLLGVEGIDRETLRSILLQAGATPGGEGHKEVTKQDLFEWGIAGGPNSAVMRKRLQNRLDLPQNLSSKALCDVLTVLGLKNDIPGLLEGLAEQKQTDS